MNSSVVPEDPQQIRFAEGVYASVGKMAARAIGRTSLCNDKGQKHMNLSSKPAHEQSQCWAQARPLWPRTSHTSTSYSRHIVYKEEQ